MDPAISSPSPLLQPSPSPSPLSLTIRFSASLPDLPLQIPEPTTTNTSALKQLIRSSLPSDLSTHRLRLIYAGHALLDAVPLSTSLKLPPPPSSLKSQTKDKGKAPIYPSSAHAPFPRYFIHCSIGDIILTPSDLAAEASLADPSHRPLPTPSTSSTSSKPPFLPPLSTTTTTPLPPRGFSRLPLSPTTLLSLRAQFTSHLSSTHPHPLSPSSLLRAEDAWLDNTTFPHASSSPNPDTADGGGGGGGGSEAGQLDDLLWGATMGFFWPVACVWWVGREEEGVWSRRRRVAVGMGGLVNLVFGVLRWMG